MQIQDLLKRDLSQTIEEIIQLDQLDEQLVYTEITEYVATGSIRCHYRELLEAINEARTNPTERVGVWISGFFGSGKSSFAKNLGYVLANRTVRGHAAADLFKAQLDDPATSSLIDVVNGTIPTEVVMFDVQKDRAQTGQGGLSISPFVYRVLLRQLGYAEDSALAELEISLEGEGRLGAFVERYNRRYAANNPRDEWTTRGRKSAEAWNRAGAIMHELDPGTYPAPESFAQGILQDRVEVTPKLLVERSFELMARRRPGKALTFIIDEIGQYMGTSQERLEDLRAVVKTFGMEGRNRARARKVPAPTWFIVTAQERLDEVTSAMGDDRRVLIAKVQDRFPLRVDLSPSDVREVAARRVLAKGTRRGEGARAPVPGERRPAQRGCQSGAHHPVLRRRRDGVRRRLPVPAALHRPLDRRHVRHPAPARCPAARQRQQPDDHQPDLPDAGQPPDRLRAAVDRCSGLARPGLRPDRGSGRFGQAEGHRRRHRALPDRSRRPGLGGPGGEGDRSPGVRA